LIGKPRPIKKALGLPEGLLVIHSTTGIDD
jgi:hypothetical protein